MRPLFAFALLLVSLVSARADEVKISHVWAEWRDTASFDRISEYFGGGENTGKHHILRTHADVRAGFYFFLRLDRAGAPAGSQFELQVIRPDLPEPKTFTFPTARATTTAVFELGLTGADWPDGGAARPVAWRLALVTADGHVLSEQKSFLWENPAK